jgi:hypothetical protein
MNCNFFNFRDMKRKKTLIIILFILILVALLFTFFYIFFINKKADPVVSAKPATPAKNTNEKSYLLENYPLDTVPLYKMKMVSSSKFFVNDDPASYAGYIGKPTNYYNVVFETDASAKDLLKYYRSLMMEVNEDSTSEEQVEG